MRLIDNQINNTTFCLLLLFRAPSGAIASASGYTRWKKTSALKALKVRKLYWSCVFRQTA